MILCHVLLPWEATRWTRVYQFYKRLVFFLHGKSRLHAKAKTNRGWQHFCREIMSSLVQLEQKSKVPICIPFTSSSSASTPETWAKFSHDNIYRAEREKLASINLRALIDNILHDISEDLRMQCAAVNEAFARRCEELDDAKHKLEHHLKKVSVIFWMLATGVIVSFEKITVDLSSRKKRLGPYQVSNTILCQLSIW